MLPWRLPVIVFLLVAGCLGAPQPLPAEAGDAAHAIVLSEPYPELIVEVDYLPQTPPAPEALQALVEALDAFTLKERVLIMPPEEIAAGQAVRAGNGWSLDEVMDAHEATFGSDARPWALGNGTRAYLHVLYLDSYLRMEEDGETTDAIGVAIQNLIVVFRGRDDRPSYPNVASTLAPEIPILLHEAGHAMGLIGRGAPEVRPHHLPDDPHHSRNPESVMFAAVDLLGYGQELFHESTKDPLDLFDEDDKADLAALRAEQGKRGGSA